MCELKKCVDELSEVMDRISCETGKIGTELSTIDKELSDLYHYIEFTNLDVFKGYKIYKELQGCLKKRREIKNQQQLAQMLNDMHINKFSNAINKCTRRIENKTYTPRIRDDLFKKIETPSSEQV